MYIYSEEKQTHLLYVPDCAGQFACIFIYQYHFMKDAQHVQRK